MQHTTNIKNKHRVVNAAGVEWTLAKQKRLAFGQKCHSCGNMNNYQSLFQSKTVATVQVDDGPNQYEICTVGEQNTHANKALVNLCVTQ